MKKLFADRAGNFAIMGAIAIVPILGCAGMAVDFSRAMDLKSRLQDAADAAVLGSIAEKSAGVAQAVGMTTDGPLPLSEAEAEAFFKARSADKSSSLKEEGIEKEKIDTEDMKLQLVKATVTKDGKNIKANLTYQVTLKTSFLRILGKENITISGSANAVYQTQSFMDFYMLLDNTPSMGVAATPADVDKMIAATKNVADSGSRNCAFACHIVAENGTINTNSNYFVAKTNGIAIRIDVVAKAVKALTEEAGLQQSYANQFRMAAYTFGEKAQDVKLLKVAELTADLSKVKAGTQDIKLMSIPYQGYNNDQQTSFDSALTKINAEISTPGDGTTSAKPEKVVFFVSDGVGDSNKPKGCTKQLTGTRCQEPIDTAYCKVLKDRQIKIAVLYTTYLPLPNNSWYNSWIKPFQTEIGARMQDCASPGFYFEVSPTQGIEAAMKALFNKVIRTPRLTS
ncbi:TadE/TadG family type IV pilus assembly protein [Rhizobium sp. PL01]|uniref:TadE/TadG family type IV pilus assembly protein n=1 Tax=Rhizobium sp. PL01 TaxID=3085631 RepID=UPI0029813098|nr:TadE/TadG family type IV pilus assembly protein [Rhizobium sp. PL01]MDW5313012.1 TadE/TadG family type IV pilus assembly protein [Rhizobium sp. PL01]